jgi:hypothetical protein
MNTAPVEFGDIEFSANRTLAYVILARESRSNYLLLVYHLSEVASELKKFLPFLTPEYLGSLSDRRKHRLTLRLQDAHMILVQLSRSPEADTCSRFPVIRRLVNRLREKTEDLARVLEDLDLIAGRGL